jgi:hypothetical protein
MFALSPTDCVPLLHHHRFFVVPVVPVVQATWNKALCWNHHRNTSGSSGDTFVHKSTLTRDAGIFSVFFQITKPLKVVPSMRKIYPL